MKQVKRLLAGLLAAMLLAVTVSPTGVLAADTAVSAPAPSEAPEPSVEPTEAPQSAEPPEASAAPEPSETPAGCEKAVFDKKPFYHTDGVV